MASDPITRCPTGGPHYFVGGDTCLCGFVPMAVTITTAEHASFRAEVERLTRDLDAMTAERDEMAGACTQWATDCRLILASRDALAAQVAALREALEAVKEIIGPAYAWAEIDRERDDTDWQACERAEKLMYAALAAAGGEARDGE